MDSFSKALPAFVFDFVVHFPALVLAVNQIAETVRHGSIFADRRARMEASGGFWSEAVRCGFCFSHWSGLVVVCYFAAGYGLSLAAVFRGLSGDVGVLCLCLWRTPIYWLAATRGAQLLNDAMHDRLRTPPRSEVPAPEGLFDSAPLPDGLEGGSLVLSDDPNGKGSS